MPSIRNVEKRTVFVYFLKTVSLIGLYYSFSIGLTFYQQWFVRREFPFPLFVVLCHYVIKFLGAGIYRKIHTCCCGDGKREWVHLGWKDYLLKVAVVGCAASVDIGLSNWSFQYITISLYTMVKSSSIIYILIIAVLLSLERCKLLTVAAVCCIAAGLFLFTYQSTQFDFWGFTLAETAALCAGIRWASSQLLMQKLDTPLHHPIDMIFHVQPWMILSIIPLMFSIEGKSLARVFDDDFFASFSSSGRLFGLICTGGVIAFFMEISEYALLVHTSSLTLNVFGIAKEIVTLILAHTYKGDEFTYLNLAGLAVCLCGVSLHVYSKASHYRPQKPDNVTHQGEENAGLINDDDTEDEHSL